MSFDAFDFGFTARVCLESHAGETPAPPGLAIRTEGIWALGLLAGSGLVDFC